MPIPPLHELLSKPYPPKNPTPAERFAPFLLPGEELLWIGQPNAECYARQYTRGVTIAFGGAAIFCTIPFVAECCASLAHGMSIPLLYLAPFMLFCMVIERTRKHSVPDCCFAVTTLRCLSYDPLSDGPELAALPLARIRRFSTQAGGGGCGTIRFNAWLPVAQSLMPFDCIEAVGSVAALIVETKQRAETGISGAVS